MARRNFGELASKTSGSADPSILQLGDQTRLRILEPAPEVWLQHDIEGEDDKGMPVFRSIACSQSPECPLCAKGRKHFPMKQRFAINVEDLNDDVKVLIAGSSIFVKGFERDANQGFTVTDYDYIIKKTGKGLGTSYDVVRMEKSDRKQPDISELHDLSRFSDAPTPEKIFSILDDLGIDYDSLQIPSFTKAEAAKKQMPFGKYKPVAGVGLTLSEILVEDPGYVDWLIGIREDAGDIADETYIAFKTLLGGGAPKERQTGKTKSKAEAEGFKEVELPSDVEAGPPGKTVEEAIAEEVAREVPVVAFICPDCGFKARTKSGFTLHMKSKHGKTDAEPAVAAPPEESEEIEDPDAQDVAEMAQTREQLVDQIKNIFLEDDRFSDFSKVGEVMNKIKKGAHALKDLDDDQLLKLLQHISL